MANKLILSIDLGSDTIKISFGFKKNGEEIVGKIVDTDSILMDTLPATAYYDEDKQKWYYSDKIERNSNGSYLTVVKIKKLLSLLYRIENKNVYEKNKDYYYNQSHFPKYYFPERSVMLENYDEMVKANKTFSANITPQMVCQGFFKYIADICRKEIKNIMKIYGIQFDEYSAVVIYPNKAGKAYISELKELVANSFNIAVKYDFNSTRAICFSAFSQNKLEIKDKALVFDMGEENLSVVKASILGSGRDKSVAIDGVDGHSLPVDIGGNSIDESIVDVLLHEVSNRDVIGSAAGESIEEEALDSKQYLLMKNVKQAKSLLSDDGIKGENFDAPLSVWKEVCIDKVFDRNQLRSIIGVDGSKTNKNKIASKILKYVLDEMSLIINDDITKVILSGGVIETLGLFDYIKSEINKLHKNISVLKMDFNSNLKSNYSILPCEDSVYCAALGGVMAALNNYKMTTIVSLSYGISFHRANVDESLLGIILDKGTELSNGVSEFSSINYSVGYSKGIADSTSIKIYSIMLSVSDMNNKKYGNKLTYIDYAPNSSEDDKRNKFKDRQRACVKIDAGQYSKNAASVANLMLVAGGNQGNVNGCVEFYYKSKRVKIKMNLIKVKLGVRIDTIGRATPFCENIDGNSDVTIIYFDSGREAIVKKSDIYVSLVGVNPIDVEAD